MLIWKYGIIGEVLPRRTGQADTLEQAVAALHEELGLNDAQVAGLKRRCSITLIDNPKAQYVEIAQQRPSWNEADLRRLKGRAGAGVVSWGYSAVPSRGNAYLTD